MNRNVILYIAMSLDGYIATEEESLAWLFRVEGEGDNGYSEFYNTVGRCGHGDEHDDEHGDPKVDTGLGGRLFAFL